MLKRELQRAKQPGWMQMEGRKTNLFVTVLEHFVNPGRVAEARNSAHPVRGKY